MMAAAFQSAQDDCSKGEKFTFFWKSDSPFSQWHNSTFVVKGVTYKCAEQYMMHQKALLFGDEKIANDIMKAKSPRQQKSLGRNVRNFNEKKWQDNCQRIVREGNLAKFSSIAQLKQALYDTAGTVLVEASPYDNIWGIGLQASDPGAQSRDTWAGQNLLGFILTDVREELMARERPKDTVKGKYSFFWRDSVFHQWYLSDFTLGDISYNCAEQHMMYQKAVFFNDNETAAKVLQTTDPQQHKALGRQVQNFDAERWSQASYDIVKAGNQAKFEQNPSLRQTLLDTAGTTLVEANPNDTLWGIGLAADDPRAQDSQQWRGRNLLGQLLTEIREEMLVQDIKLD